MFEYEITRSRIPGLQGTDAGMLEEEEDHQRDKNALRIAALRSVRKRRGQRVAIMSPGGFNERVGGNQDGGFRGSKAARPEICPMHRHSPSDGSHYLSHTDFR